MGFLMLKNNIGGPHVLSQALQQVIDYYVKNDVNAGWLELAGYQRDKETKRATNKLNGCPFNATDAEDLLCKGWVDAKLTLGHYHNARRPQAALHCHPRDVECSWLKTIMEEIVLKYAKMCRGLDPPDFCILPGETLDCNAQ